MSKYISDQDLSKYNRYILNRIISGFEINKPFNVYELVRESVSYKCILPSQNELIMETYYNIKEYLLQHDFVIEEREMSSYHLTGKGIELKSAQNLDLYEDAQIKKNKKSIFQSLFFSNKDAKTQKTYMPSIIEQYE